MTTTLDMLIQKGIALPPPRDLADDAIHDKLWEAINGLGTWGIFLQHTNHLSDRELYEWLWEKILPEEQKPFEEGAMEIVDLVEYGDPEQNLIYIKYYAGELERQGWTPEDLPGDLDELPPHEDPPYDRDDRLPQWGNCLLEEDA